MRKLLLLLVPTLLSAQARPSTITRSTTKFGDSSIVVVSDTNTSKTTFLTRTASVAQLRKALSKFTFDSVLSTAALRAATMSHGRDSMTINTALVFTGTDTIIGAPVWASGILGTTTNNSAGTGVVGEYISGARATGSSLSLSTGTSLTVDSISLTAGDWDVAGTVAFTFGATTSYTNLIGSINTVTNVVGAQGTFFDYETAANIPTATADATWNVPMVRISIASTTTVFLVAQATFTASTLKGYGTMRARRVR